jgi:hypothetical protein
LNQDWSTHVTTATISEALDATPTMDELPHLHSGSWINQDFKIWIGHQEDNRGWDLLGHTRSRLLELSPTLPPERAQAAWNELYAAEGSDWFWWYGDDFETAYKEEFDRMFRAHLKNAWTLAGATAPELLADPIWGARTSSEGDQVTHPLCFLHPTLDGQVTDFFEWRGAGTINPRPPLGAMWKTEEFFRAIYFGWDLEHLFFRLDPDEQSRNRPSLRAELHIQTPTTLFRVSWQPAANGPHQYVLAARSADGQWQDVGVSRLLHCQTIVELAIPFKDLSLKTGQTIALSLLILDQELEVARYPHQQPAIISLPGPEFEATMWRV